MSYDQFEGHTPGEWNWAASKYRVMLHTTTRGQVYVMDFVRMGMQQAQPRFQEHRPDCDGNCSGCGIMTTALELAEPLDHNGCGVLSHPDARLIAAAPALLERCRRYEKALREIDTISATTNMPDQALGNINEITTEALNG